MQYLVLVPTASRICELMHERDLYEELCNEVSALVGDSDLADECMDYMLHCLLCDHLGVHPQIELDLEMLLGKCKATMVKEVCSHFYFDGSMLYDYMCASTHVHNFRHTILGWCVNHTGYTMLVQEGSLMNDEDRLWRI